MLPASTDYRFTITAWGHTHHFLEQAREIIGIVVANFVGDFMDRHLRKSQQGASTLHLEMDKIIIGE